MKEEEGQRWLIPAVMGYDPGSNSVCARGKRRGWDLALVSPWNGCHACRSFPCKSCSLDGCALVDRWPASSPLSFSFFFLLAWRKGRSMNLLEEEKKKYVRSDVQGRNFHCRASLTNQGPLLVGATRWTFARRHRKFLTMDRSKIED